MFPINPPVVDSTLFWIVVEIAGEKEPDVTLVTNNEFPPFWKYWFAAIEVR